MDDAMIFPGHIHRAEELQILEEVAKVRESRASRVLLLYGPGGIGKTSLVRRLAEVQGKDTAVVWVDPIDVDDPECWLLSNLERRVAKDLDPHGNYFASYQQYLSHLPSYTRPHISHETVVSHLSKIKQEFNQCYKNFIDISGKTPVISFDTVEAIRGMYLATTLTQWMKALPATLFILAGRGLAGTGEKGLIKYELEEAQRPISVKEIELNRFNDSDALAYLRESPVLTGLADEEKVRLVHLTRGYPLWLAFTVAYLRERGMPEEADQRFTGTGGLPLDGITPGRVEAFKRRLVTPYRETDFWHECDKRLAVVRHSVDEDAWQQLMCDRPLPLGVESYGEAWKQLQKMPWIRVRANERFVTLHDAVAEELAQRIIPVHDQNRTWRKEQWRRAVLIYAAKVKAKEPVLNRIADLDARLQAHAKGRDRETSPDESAFIKEAADLDDDRRELNQLRVIWLYYQVLSEFEAGCALFLELFDLARREHDILFQELLALEMQRFLPGGVDPRAVGDVTGEVISDFRDWLKSKKPRLHLDIGLNICEYLIENEQATAAAEIIAGLPRQEADVRQNYRMEILLGNAYMRIPGKVRMAQDHFLAALKLAEGIGHKAPDRRKLVAEAYKEMGFYYRNAGQWGEADNAYAKARNTMADALSAQASDENREEMASILTNWAYVKALLGSYREGMNLAESAIVVRNRLGLRREEGMSWSVCGEVYHYEQRFQKAWGAYAEAERIFQEDQNWSWLGLIYQKQAICLFQAAQEGVTLLPGTDAVERAKELITLALDVCRDRAIRGYPSALNRAGRIYGENDVSVGLKYLDEAITQARNMHDGWFWFTSFIEYVELCYRAWERTSDNEDDEYLRRIEQISYRETEAGSLMPDYEFPSLKGRWRIFQGHMRVYDWLKNEEAYRLDEALEDYKEGFALIAEEFAGLPGESTIPTEFARFAKLFRKLSPDSQADWLRQFRQAWKEPAAGSTVLLARLEELY